MQLTEIPDFTKDPRRKARALKALEFAYSLQLSPRGMRAIRAVELRKIIGKKSDAIGGYLHTLFRQHGAYSLNGNTFKYEAVNHRVERLEELVDNRNGLLAFARANGKDFDSDPVYGDWAGDRRFGWWTNMRKDLREKLFLMTHGVLYDYDIQAAAPTLLLQAWRAWMAENKPFILANSDECKVPTWTELVDNRSTFRERFRAECNLTLAEAKYVIQAVMNSGRATAHEMPELDSDRKEVIRASPLYQGLVTDFGVVWRHWREVAGDGTAGEAMSAMYRALERRVMTVIEANLKTRAWFVHDGFMSVHPVDVPQLEREVKLATGWKIKLEEQEKTPAGWVEGGAPLV